MMHDQAAGLRRIFSPVQPGVTAIVPCSAVTTSWLAGRLRERMARFSGQRLLVLDEWLSYGNVGDCLGMASRFDLLQAADLRVSKGDCVRIDEDGLAHVRVAELVNVWGDDRQRIRRSLDMLNDFCAEYDQWILVPSLGNVFEGISPFLMSVSEIVLVLDAHPKSVTVAWSVLQSLRDGQADRRFSVCQIGSRADVSARMVTDFCSLARTRLGVSLSVVRTFDQVLDRLDARQAGSASSSARSFMERLGRVCAPAGQTVCDWHSDIPKPLLA